MLLRRQRDPSPDSVRERPMYTRRGSVSLHYEILGADDAPPLVMVRGLSRTARHWGQLPSLLANHFRVVLFDNRGVGRSSVPRPPYTTAAMADDTVAVMDAAGVPKANVFGVSLGGMIAQELAIRHPRRVSALALGCTRSGRGAPRIPFAALATLVGALRHRPDAAIAKTAPLILSSEFLREHPEIVEAWQKLVREEPLTRRGVLGQLMAGALHDASENLARVRCPALVITGDADRLIPAACSHELVSRIAGAKLSILKGAGHDFPTERPEETARQLTEFFFASAEKLGD